MDKIVITREMIPETETREIEMGNGVVFEVKKCIPYDMKQVMAFEMYMLVMTIDQENDLVYKSYKRQLIKTISIVKYYTNIDIQNMDSSSGWPLIHDWLISTGLYDQMNDIVRHDFDIVCAIYRDMYDMSKLIHDETHNITYHIKHMLNTNFEGKDIMQALAQAPDLNNTMVAMMDAYKKQNASGHTETGKVNAGNGMVLNMAKKKMKH